MTAAPELQTMSMTLGEVRGQLRELIHSVNNLAQKQDAMAEKVISHAILPEKIADHEERISSLETDRDKREGAVGAFGWIMRSPIIGWIVGAAVAAWAMLGGHR